MQITRTVADNVEEDLHASLKLNFLFRNYHWVKSLNFLKSATYISPVFLFYIPVHFSLKRLVCLRFIFSKSFNVLRENVRGKILIQIEQMPVNFNPCIWVGLRYSRETEKFEQEFMSYWFVSQLSFPSFRPLPWLLLWFMDFFLLKSSTSNIYLNSYSVF